MPSRKDRGKRPLLVALATALLLLAGAGAIAIARTDSAPTMVQPKGSAAPFGVGYVDGFGEHSPNPTLSAKPKRPPKPKQTTTARPTPISSFEIFVSESPESKQDEVLTTSGLSAVYWTETWYGYYETYVWVHNDGPDPAAWQVRIKLPATATITAAWETSRSAEPGNVWTFTSPNGTKLAPGRTYLFAFEGKRLSGPFQLGFCTVNGGACTAFS